jgi:hypothetical protein
VILEERGPCQIVWLYTLSLCSLLIARDNRSRHSDAPKVVANTPGSYIDPTVTVQNNTELSDSLPADHHGEESLVGGAIVDSALNDVLNARFFDDSESEESGHNFKDEEDDEGEVN